MKIHKIEDDRLTLVRTALARALVHLRDGSEKQAETELYKLQQNLVTEGPFHEDRWKIVWMTVPKGYLTRPEFIPISVWEQLTIRNLWAYDDSLTTHYCSAEKLKLLHPLGVTSADVDWSKIRNFQNTLCVDFFDKLNEFATEAALEEHADYSSLQEVERHNPTSTLWLSDRCQEAWKEYQEDHPDVDFDDDDVRTTHIVEFLREYCDDSTPYDNAWCDDDNTELLR